MEKGDFLAWSPAASRVGRAPVPDVYYRMSGNTVFLPDLVCPAWAKTCSLKGGYRRE